MLNKNHGGLRVGSGRPKEGGNKLIRVSLELEPLIIELKKFRKLQIKSENDTFRLCIYNQIIDILKKESTSKKVKFD